MVDQLDKNVNIDRKCVVSDSSYYLTVDNLGSADSSSRSPSPNRSIKGLSLFRAISRKIGKNIRKSKEEKCTSSDDDEDSNCSMNSIPRSVKKNQNRKNDNINECDCDYFYKNSRNQLIGLKNRSITISVESDSSRKKTNEEYQIKNGRCLRFSTPCARHHNSSGSDAYSSNDDSSASNDLESSTNRNRFSSNDSSASSTSGSDGNSTGIRKVLKTLNINTRSLSCSSITQMKDISFGERRESSSKEKRSKKSPQKILRQPVSYTYVKGISGLPTHRVVNTRGCYNNQYSRGYC